MRPRIEKGWIFILLATLILYSGYIVRESGSLPEKVATHFNSSGTPNGWMTKSKNMVFFLAFGPGITVFLISIGSVIQQLPSKYLNVPNANYWRSAEHYPRGCFFILKMLMILSIGLLIFLAMIFHLVSHSNQSHPPHFNNEIMGRYKTFLHLFLGGWVFSLYYYFLRKPQK